MSTFSPESFSCFPSGYIFRRAGFPYRSLQCSKKEKKKKEKEEDEKNVNWIIFSSFFLPLMLYSKRAPAYVKKVTLLLFHAPFTLFWQLGNEEKRSLSETSIIIYLQTYFLYSH
jgi:hypothetical protein